MAEIIEINQMLNQIYEPLRKFRWIIEIDGMDAFHALTSGRPKLQGEATEVPYLNGQQYFAGKMKPQPITVKFIEAIAPNQAQKAMEWARLIFESETGRAGYKAQYSKTIILKLLSPAGEVVQRWKLFGAWPKAVNPDDLDYGSEEVLGVEVEIQYDRFSMLF